MRASRGEIKIEDILRAAELNFKEEYIFPDLVSSNGRPLRFDFAVFDDCGDLDFLIEYQGIQHYGYKLIEIPYIDEALIDYDYIMKRAGY